MKGEQFRPEISQDERPSSTRISELAKSYASKANIDALLDIDNMAHGMDPSAVDASFPGWIKNDFKRLHTEALELITEELKELRKLNPEK